MHRQNVEDEFANVSAYIHARFFQQCFFDKFLSHFGTYMSQLLRVGPSALANSLPAIGWRPASRGRPGATRDVCDLYTFLLGRAPLVATERGGPCSVLYSDPLRAVGTPVPGETNSGASHYSGSPLKRLN